MVIMYATRHWLPIPSLARWLLTLGIVATLAVNTAQGWSHGPVGAAVAAWPAASLVGSYELLVWIIRTAAAGGPVRVPDADHVGPQAGQHGSDARSAAGKEPGAGPEERYGIIGLVPDGADSPRLLVRAAEVDQASGPGQGAADHVDHVDQATGWVPGYPSAARTVGSRIDIDAAAVATYQASVQAGSTLSERKLAGMFGKTSRRWARNRIDEARQSTAPA